MLSDRLAKKAVLTAKKKGLKIYEYSIGAKYSYAIVKGKRGYAMGTAYLPLEDISRGFCRSLSLDNLQSMIASLNMQEKSLGIAVINAISQYLLWNINEYKGDIEYGNLIDCVKECCPDGKIAVVGNMVPLVKKLQEEREVWVLERNPKLRINAYPDSLAPRILPKADTVIITGATLVNDTIDYILSLSKRAKLKILVGPTAALYPEWIKGYVDVIASLKIDNLEKVVEIIKCGGGRWDFTPYAREYIIRL